MTKQTAIGFFLSTLLLAGFEYLFLTEVYTTQRPLPLILSLAGVLLSGASFLIFFIKYRKATDDN